MEIKKHKSITFMSINIGDNNKIKISTNLLTKQFNTSIVICKSTIHNNQLLTNYIPIVNNWLL